MADNTFFQNPNIELDVVPKGRSVFYLSRMLGPLTAQKYFSRRKTSRRIRHSSWIL